MNRRNETDEERAARITVQVAVEAIGNNPRDYDATTVAAVRAAGERHGIGRLYMDGLPTFDSSDDWGDEGALHATWCNDCSSGARTPVMCQ